jgi:hypothetical protein
VAGIYYQGMDAHNQVAVSIHKMGFHPLDRLARIPGGVRKDKLGSPRDFQFHYACDFDLAYLPLVHICRLRYQ